MRLPLIALLTWILTIAAAMGQVVPDEINYQGTLLDGSGNPLTGSHDLVFQIYDDPSAGVQIGSNISIPGVNFDSAGRFNVILTGMDDEFDAPNRYLQITVDGGSPITPRQQFLSTPYAIRAESAAVSDQTDFAQLAAVAQAAEPGSITPAMLEPAEWSSSSWSTFATTTKGSWVEVPGSSSVVSNPAGRPLLVHLSSTNLAPLTLTPFNGGLGSTPSIQARVRMSVNGGAQSTVRSSLNNSAQKDISNIFLVVDATGVVEFTLEIFIANIDFLDSGSVSNGTIQAVVL